MFDKLRKSSEHFGVTSEQLRVKYVNLRQSDPMEIAEFFKTSATWSEHREQTYMLTYSESIFTSFWSLLNTAEAPGLIGENNASAHFFAVPCKTTTPKRGIFASLTSLSLAMYWNFRNKQI